MQFIPSPGDERVAAHSVAGRLTAVHALELLCAGLNRALKKKQIRSESRKQIRSNKNLPKKQIKQIRSDQISVFAQQIRSDPRQKKQIRSRSAPDRSDQIEPGDLVQGLIAWAAHLFRRII